MGTVGDLVKLRVEVTRGNVDDFVGELQKQHFENVIHALGVESQNPLSNRMMERRAKFRKGAIDLLATGIAKRKGIIE